MFFSNPANIARLKKPQPPSGGGGGAFTPASVALTMQQWNDASVLGLSNGAAIANFSNLAALGKDATATGTAQPTYVASFKNGLGVVLYNGTTNVSTTVNWAAALAQPFTLCLVYKDPDGSGGGRFLDSNGNGGRIVLLPNIELGIYTGNAIQPMYNMDANWHFAIIKVNGASTQYAIDGGSFSTVSGDPGTNSIAGLSIGGDYLGNNGHVYIAELMIYQGIISSGDTASLNTYVTSKWGTMNVA